MNIKTNKSNLYLFVYSLIGLLSVLFNLFFFSKDNETESYFTSKDEEMSTYDEMLIEAQVAEELSHLSPSELNQFMMDQY
jgi:hypothetical protein